MLNSDVKLYILSFLIFSKCDNCKKNLYITRRNYYPSTCNYYCFIMCIFKKIFYFFIIGYAKKNKF